MILILIYSDGKKSFEKKNVLRKREINPFRPYVLRIFGNVLGDVSVNIF